MDDPQSQSRQGFVVGADHCHRGEGHMHGMCWSPRQHLHVQKLFGGNRHWPTPQFCPCACYFSLLNLLFPPELSLPPSVVLLQMSSMSWRTAIPTTRCCKRTPLSWCSLALRGRPWKISRPCSPGPSSLSAERSTVCIQLPCDFPSCPTSASLMPTWRISGTLCCHPRWACRSPKPRHQWLHVSSHRGEG